MAVRSRVTLLIEAKNRARQALRGADRGFRNFGDRVRSRFQRIRQSISAVRLALVGMVGFLVGRVARDLISKFNEQQAAVERLRASLIAAGKDGVESLKLLTDEATRLQRMTTAADEALIRATASVAQLAPSLNVRELRQAQTVLVSIADLFFEGNLDTAARMLGRTLGSTTNALVRYGVEIDTAGNASQRLAEILQNQVVKAGFEVAQAAAETMEGRSKQLRNAWGDLREEIGGLVVDFFGLQDGTKSLTDHIFDLTDAIRENREAWALWGRGVLRQVADGAKAIFNLVKMSRRAFEAWTFLFRGLVRGLISGILRIVQDGMVDPINRVLDGLTKIPGVNIDFRINDLPVERFAAESEEAIDGLTRAWGEFTDAANEAWRAAQRALAAADETTGFIGPPLSARGRPARPSVPGEGTGQAGEAAEDILAEIDREIEAEIVARARERLVEIRRRQRAADRFGLPETDVRRPSGLPAPEEVEQIAGATSRVNAMLREQPSMWRQIGEEIGEVITAQELLARVMADIVHSFVVDFAGAFQTAARAAVEGSQSMGKAFQNAMLEATASVAAGMSRFYAAKAVAALGEGLLGNPRGFAAAAKFTAAAAAFGMLAGGLQGLAGRGGGGGASGSFEAGIDDVGRTERPPATLIIEGGVLDMSDPRQEDAFRRALEDLSGRRVTVIRR